MAQNHTISHFLSALLVAALSAGCFGSEPPQRGTLSEATEKASDDNKGDRKVSTPPQEAARDDDRDNHNDNDNDTNNTLGVILDILTGSDGSSTTHSTWLRPAPWYDPSDTTEAFDRIWISIAGGAAPTTSSSFATLSSVGLHAAGSFGERARFGGYFGLDRLPMRTSSALLTSLQDDLAVTRIGIQYSYVATSLEAPVGLYVLGGGGFSHFGWTFRNPIVSGNDIIASDGIDGFEVYGGLGLRMLQSSRVNVALEAAPSVTMWKNTTEAGFANDVFENFFAVKLRVLLSVRITGE